MFTVVLMSDKKKLCKHKKKSALELEFCILKDTYATCKHKQRCFSDAKRDFD